LHYHRRNTISLCTLFSVIRVWKAQRQQAPESKASCHKLMILGICALLCAANLLVGRVGAWTQQTNHKHQSAAVAKKASGALVAWGNGAAGGDTSDVDDLLTSGVNVVSSTDSAFAALKDDGTVVSWGSALMGGVMMDWETPVHLMNWLVVVEVVPNESAFAAITDSGDIYVWGNEDAGGVYEGSTWIDLSSPVQKSFHRRVPSLRCARTGLS
jgi:hypothetical protein